MFLLEDESLFHMEFQANYLRDALIRFAEYDLGLHRQHKRDVRTAIFYGPAVTRHPPALRMPTLHGHPHVVLLGRRSGTRALRRLQARIRSGLALDEADRVDLMFLLLMQHQQPAEIIVHAAVSLARQLPQPEQGRTLGPILGLAYHYLGKRILNTLMEELMATSTMREYFANAIEQGIVTGRRDYILRTLIRRFGTVPGALQERLTQVTDLARLDALFDAALTVSRIEEFEALL